MYSDYARVVPDRRCNGFTINNAGTTNVFYNNSIILPGQSFSVGGNEGEIFVGRIEIKFAVPSPAPPIVTNLAIVSQKFYVEESFI